MLRFDLRLRKLAADTPVLPFQALVSSPTNWEELVQRWSELTTTHTSGEGPGVVRSPTRCVSLLSLLGRGDVTAVAVTAVTSGALATGGP